MLCAESDTVVRSTVTFGEKQAREYMVSTSALIVLQKALKQRKRSIVNTSRGCVEQVYLMSLESILAHPL